MNFNEENEMSIIILKAFYKSFFYKIIQTEYSENVFQILSYFNSYNPNEKLIKNQSIKEEKKIEKQYSKEINELIYIYKEIKNKLSIQNEHFIKLDKNLNYLEILNQDIIYIPIIGESKSGKSKLLNCIIGYQLFPESINKCTTRGIIIQYSKNIELYEIKLNSEYSFFNFSKNKIPIAKGINQVKQYLISLNYEYSKEKNKNIYIVKTPIQFLDDYKIDEEIKNKISFIDLPGTDIKNNNNYNLLGNNFYNELFKISSSMIFISKVGEIKTDENQYIINLYKNSKIDEINESKKNDKNNYLDNCLFVVNIFKDLIEDEIDIENVQKEYYNLLFTSNDNYDYKNIKAAIFDAKSYEDYLEIWNLFFKIEDLFKKYQKDFVNQLNISSYYNPLKEKDFPNYCLKQINMKIKNISIEIEKEIEDDEYFYTEIKQIIVSLMEEINQKIKDTDESIIKEIAKLLKQVHLNIKTIKFYQESYCEDFFTKLSQQIVLANQNLNKQYTTIFIDTLHIFSYIENNLLDEKKKKIITQAKKEMNKLTAMKDLSIKIKALPDKFTNIVIIVNKSFNYIRDNSDSILKNYNNTNEKIITDCLKNKIINDLSTEISNLNSIMHDLDLDCKENNIQLDEIYQIFGSQGYTNFGNLIKNYIVDFISPKVLKPLSKSFSEWFMYYFIKSYKEQLLEAITSIESEFNHDISQKINVLKIKLENIKVNTDSTKDNIDYLTVITNEKIKLIDELKGKLSVISNEIINEDF